MPALPDSPRNSTPDPSSAALLRRHSSFGGNSRYAPNRTLEIRDNVLNTAEKVQRRIFSTIRRMTPIQRVLAAGAILVAGALGLLFLIFNERIFGWLEPYAEKWKHTTGGWIILWFLTFLTAFPPMIGFSSCGTMAGFVYGIGEGWLIYASATVAGSYVSLIVSRTVLRKYVERMVANDKRFAALTLTLKEDGLKLLCMIRLCPLPYSLSNGAMSTFPTVKPEIYALATALVTPKLFIHVFIGSRLALIAKNKGQMSTSTKLLNWASIAFFATVAAVTGWVIYQKTMARARQLEDEEAHHVRNAQLRTGAPPGEFMDDPEAQVAAQTLAQGDDGVAYFDDEPSPQPYRDQQRRDDDGVFSKADGDGGHEDDDPWGLDSPKP